VPTNVAIDDGLLAEALRVGGHRTRRETVNEALAEYVQRRKRRHFVKLFGTVDFRPDWDYKKARLRSRVWSPSTPRALKTRRPQRSR
jgi:Arc/MetJ family transcription regulator